MASPIAGDVTVQTGVDALLTLLKEKKKMSVDQAAKELQIEQTVLQTWVDFLVEESVVGVEYKFTKPYIYLIESEDGGKESKAKDLNEAKQFYYEELTKRGVGEDQLEYFWKNKLLSEARDMKDYFVKKATESGLKNADFLWDKFLNKLIQ